VQVDLVIVGSGFGGSVMAMAARRIGLSVVLLEQSRHPRMAIGESTTPLSNLLLERISATYDLPRLAPLAKWGNWQRAYPQIACGLKRGFSFFCQGERLLVAASPRDDIADTHWYREEVDHFLVTEAQVLGVEYYDCVRIEDLAFTNDCATVVGRAGDRPFRLSARMLIDATGPRGFLHRSLRLPECALPGMPVTESLFSHFTGVGLTDYPGDTVPYPVDDAAVHHVFDGGWVWVLRFNNGVTSAGVAATQAVAAELKLSEGEPSWRRILDRLPALRSQFEHAMRCQPFRHMPAVSFRSGTIVGKRWAMLPSAAGFVDPLLSTGFTLTLQGIERLALILQKGFDSAELSVRLQGYAEQTDSDLMSASRLIGALYATMDNFLAFIAVSLLYFAAVSFSEAAFRLGKPELAPGLLLPSAAVLLERAHTLGDGAETQAFTEEVLRVIEPFNLGRFGDPTLHIQYPVRAEDLL
jgi:FADH2 O2-dependent halogenase